MASKLEADKVISDAVTADTHHFEDYRRGHDELFGKCFFCKLEFAARACAYSGVLTAASLISSPSYAWKRQDTRETLEDFNVQLLCGIPVL